MKYYQAVCSEDGYKSPLYLKRVDALKAEGRHLRTNGSHDTKVLLVLLSDDIYLTAKEIEKT